MNSCSEHELPVSNILFLILGLHQGFEGSYLIINKGMLNDPDNYDPNIDDPLNKYTYEEKRKIVSEARYTAVYR